MIVGTYDAHSLAVLFKVLNILNAEVFFLIPPAATYGGELLAAPKSGTGVPPVFSCSTIDGRDARPTNFLRSSDAIPTTNYSTTMFTSLFGTTMIFRTDLLRTLSRTLMDVRAACSNSAFSRSLRMVILSRIFPLT
jgi:hypothetical protein